MPEERSGFGDAGPLPISMPAVSRHLKVLERAALISRTRSGKWRASRLEAAALRDAAGWVERYQRLLDWTPPHGRQ